MPDAPQPAPQPAGAAGAPPADQAAAPAPVTREEFAAVVAQLTEARQHLSNMRNAARRVTGRDPAVQPAADAEPTAEQRDTLTSIRAEIERDRAAARDEKIDAALDKFAAQEGVTNTKLFKLFVRSEHLSQSAREKITVSNGEVVYDDGLGTLHPFAELGKKILSSQDGSTFLPPPETPGPVGQRTNMGVALPAGTKPVTQWTDAEIDKDLAGYGKALGAAFASLQPK